MVRVKRLPMRSAQPRASANPPPSVLFFGADEDDEISSEDFSGGDEELLLPEHEYAHPLAHHPEVHVTRVQELITQAIVGNGFGATINSIVVWLTKWVKKNGAIPGIEAGVELKQVVRSNLVHASPLHVALFKREGQGRNDRHQYRLVFTYEEGLTTGAELYVAQQKKLKRLRQQGELKRKAQTRGVKRKSSKKRSKAAVPPELPVEASEDVKVLAIQAVKQAGGSAPLFSIVDYIKENAERVRLGTESQADFFARLSSLVEKSPVLEADPTASNQFRVADDAGIPASSEVGAAAAPSESLAASSSSSTRLQRQSSKSRKDRVAPPLTQLQVEMARIIRESGGSASFQVMHDEILKIFDRLRRRDGSAYTADAGRAIKASLANNPASNPIFNAIETGGVKMWTNTARAEEALEESRGELSAPVHDDGEDGEAYEEPTSQTRARRRRTARRRKSDEPSSKKVKKGYSAMQAVLVKVIAVHGGEADLETIMSEVERNWHLLRRKDGSSYSSDTARAVKASLGNTSAPNPLFARHSEKEGWWVIHNMQLRDIILGDWDHKYPGFEFEGPEGLGVEPMEVEGEEAEEQVSEQVAAQQDETQ